jgi:hypothetical protein
VDMKIAAVIDYFDEEQTQPASYVVELRPGLYEAHCHDEFGCWSNYERVLGVFMSCKAAIRAIWHHLRQDNYLSFLSA